MKVKKINLFLTLATLLNATSYAQQKKASPASYPSTPNTCFGTTQQANLNTFLQTNNAQNADLSGCNIMEKASDTSNSFNLQGANLTGSLLSFDSALNSASFVNSINFSHAKLDQASITGIFINDVNGTTNNVPILNNVDFSNTTLNDTNIQIDYTSALRKQPSINFSNAIGTNVNIAIDISAFPPPFPALIDFTSATLKEAKNINTFGYIILNYTDFSAAQNLVLTGFVKADNAFLQSAKSATLDIGSSKVTGMLFLERETLSLQNSNLSNIKDINLSILPRADDPYMDQSGGYLKLTNTNFSNSKLNFVGDFLHASDYTTCDLPMDDSTNNYAGTTFTLPNPNPRNFQLDIQQNNSPRPTWTCN